MATYNRVRLCRPMLASVQDEQTRETIVVVTAMVVVVL